MLEFPDGSNIAGEEPCVENSLSRAKTKPACKKPRPKTDKAAGSLQRVEIVANTVEATMTLATPSQAAIEMRSKKDERQPLQKDRPRPDHPPFNP